MDPEAEPYVLAGYGIEVPAPRFPAPEERRVHRCAAGAGPRAQPAPRNRAEAVLRHLRGAPVAAAERTPLVGGNWKCNGTLADSRALARAVRARPGVDVVVAPPAVHLAAVQAELAAGVGLAAQDVSAEGAGAHTGLVSAEMLRDLGAGWAVVGHSEPRARGETDALASAKAARALEQGLRVIACVGESLAEREAGRTLRVVLRQLAAFEAVVPPGAWLDGALSVAYEPVWAIGTGRTASPEQAQEVHAAIRRWLAERVSPAAAAATRVIYGGSVKPANAAALIAQEDVDGFLVGGASLSGESFGQIVGCV